MNFMNYLRILSNETRFYLILKSAQEPKKMDKYIEI